jgi:hypothetical protein
MKLTFLSKTSNDAAGDETRPRASGVGVHRRPKLHVVHYITPRVGSTRGRIRTSPRRCRVPILCEAEYKSEMSEWTARKLRRVARHVASGRTGRYIAWQSGHAYVSVT